MNTSINKKIFISILLIAFLFVIATIISFFDFDEMIQNKIEEPKEIVNNYYYSSLDDVEKKYYTLLYNASIEYEGTFKYYFSYDTDKFSNAYNAFICDYPFYYWWGNGINTNSRLILKTCKANNFDKNEVSNNCKKIIENAKSIINVCKTENDYDTIKNIHDYLANNIEYVDGLNNSHNIVGALIDGKCVCDGYSYAFKYLTEIAGYKNIIIIGDAHNGKEIASHAWNKIEINDNWYNVDLTWDDGASKDDDKIDYMYFLATDEVFNTNHYPNEREYPRCDDESLYFLNIPGIFMENFDKKQITDFIVFWLKRKENNFYFKFINEEDALKASEWLINDKGFGSIFRKYYDHYSGIVYGSYQEDSTGRLHIYFEYN